MKILLVLHNSLPLLCGYRAFQTNKTMISGAQHGTPGTLPSPVPTLTRAGRDKA